MIDRSSGRAAVRIRTGTLQKRAGRSARRMAHRLGGRPAVRGKPSGSSSDRTSPGPVDQCVTTSERVDKLTRLRIAIRASLSRSLRPVMEWSSQVSGSTAPRRSGATRLSTARSRADRPPISSPRYATKKSSRRDRNAWARSRSWLVARTSGLRGPAGWRCRLAPFRFDLSPGKIRTIDPAGRSAHPWFIPRRAGGPPQCAAPDGWRYPTWRSGIGRPQMPRNGIRIVVWRGWSQS